MVKRVLFVALVSLLVINMAAPAFCDTPTTKLGRGLANMITFPLEVPEQISRTNNSDGPFAAGTVGVLRGLGWAIGRACVGAYEAVTFMLPLPKDYKAILRDPEYFLESSNF
ncbi:MAG: exosortase system-associated protein, TIGR04073 family [Candidatus Omnitrophota bacterium]|nr:exosortase system-associated protein, TIGR04073 family [Candidatus Omnitrophota bacterium]